MNRPRKQTTMESKSTDSSPEMNREGLLDDSDAPIKRQRTAEHDDVSTATRLFSNETSTSPAAHASTPHETSVTTDQGIQAVSSRETLVQELTPSSNEHPPASFIGVSDSYAFLSSQPSGDCVINECEDNTISLFSTENTSMVSSLTSFGGNSSLITAQSSSLRRTISSSSGSRGVASVVNNNLSMNTGRSSELVSTNQTNSSRSNLYSMYSNRRAPISSSTSVIQSTSSATTGGFSTASGRPLVVSQASIDRARALLAPEHEPLTNPALPTDRIISVRSSRDVVDGNESVLPNSSFGSFTSASGRAIPVSSASLRAAQSLLQDDEDTSVSSSRSQEVMHNNPPAGSPGLFEVDRCPPRTGIFSSARSLVHGLPNLSRNSNTSFPDMSVFSTIIASTSPKIPSSPYHDGVEEEQRPLLHPNYVPPADFKPIIVSGESSTVIENDSDGTSEKQHENNQSKQINTSSATPRPLEKRSIAMSSTQYTRVRALMKKQRKEQLQALGKASDNDDYDDDDIDDNEEENKEDHDNYTQQKSRDNDKNNYDNEDNECNENNYP